MFDTLAGCIIGTMSQVIVFLLLAVAAIATFVWVLNAMISTFCPTCDKDGLEENVVPILPYVRWWCPACGTIHGNSEVIRKKTQDKDDNELPRL
jgi:hypothetical protein